MLALRGRSEYPDGADAGNCVVVVVVVVIVVVGDY